MATLLRTAKTQAAPAPGRDEGVPAASADTPCERRARYFDSSNAFALKYPPVPCHQFLAERDLALDPASPTGLIPLDLSAPLGLEFPATTPLIMTYYARVRAGEQLATRFKASGELYYVIAGHGETRSGDALIAWGPGDVVCLPGGAATSHRAGAQDCVLWVITNEPQLAFEHLEPPAPGNAVTEAVHYPAAEIKGQLARVADKLKGQKIAGLALVFSSTAQARRRNAPVLLSIQARLCSTKAVISASRTRQGATTSTPPGRTVIRRRLARALRRRR